MKFPGLLHDTDIKFESYTLNKLLNYVERKMPNAVRNIDIVVKILYTLPELWRDLIIKENTEEKIKELTLKEFFETLEEGRFCKKPEKIKFSVRFFYELKDGKDDLIMVNDEFESGFMEINLERKKVDFDNNSIFVKPKNLSIEEIYQINEDNSRKRYYPEDLEDDLLNQLYKRINIVRNYKDRNFQSRGYLERWIVFSSDKPEYLKVKKDPKVKMDRALLVEKTKEVKTNSTFSFFKFSLSRRNIPDIDSSPENFEESMDDILEDIEDLIEMGEKEIDVNKPEKITIKLIYKGSTHIERGINIVLENIKIGEVIDVIKGENNSLIYTRIKYIYFLYITRNTKAYLISKNSRSYIELITSNCNDLISIEGEDLISCHSKNRWILDKLSLSIRNYINNRISRFSNWVAIQLLGVS